ncbi:Acetone carboxylase, gamma subunit [Georgfuchsia toluolica]|uniref:Acetone carboxylase, gamma subunit n=1 Tax=Georgfuchsia toluolica TaxID=424218 RepID=A0A916N9W4_9PROT|nr:acetone carboxylase subunit gamma [Georgfuchsia toluolica]CAG4885149.1 Acetone carboxylase, gamma subunit [Georgfuchsia toluolica]
MSTSYDKRELKLLIDGQLPFERVQEIIKDPKDTDRFQKSMEVYEERVAFKERILLPLTPCLFIVQDGTDYVVKCRCGHGFGDFRVNWKLHSLVYVRDTAETLEQVYPGVQVPDPDYCEIREYYCPECAALLEVESLPPGMPADFEFLPDLDTFYRKWLNDPLPTKVEFVDKTSEVIRQWVSEITPARKGA